MQATLFNNDWTIYPEHFDIFRCNYPGFVSEDESVRHFLARYRIVYEMLKDGRQFRIGIQALNSHGVPLTLDVVALEKDNSEMFGFLIGVPTQDSINKITNQCKNFKLIYVCPWNDGATSALLLSNPRAEVWYFLDGHPDDKMIKGRDEVHTYLAQKHFLQQGLIGKSMKKHGFFHSGLVNITQAELAGMATIYLIKDRQKVHGGLSTYSQEGDW